MPLRSFALAALAGCAPAIGGSSPRPSAGLVAVGDGVLAAYADAGASVAHVAGGRLGAKVRVDARPGARLLADPIAPPAGDGWLVVSAGAADLSAECGCRACWDTLDRLLTVDAQQGALVELVDRSVRAGRKVALVSTPPGPEPAARACNAHQATLAARARALAEGRDDVVLVDARALGVTAPLTPQGAATLGAAVADRIAAAEGG